MYKSKISVFLTLAALMEDTYKCKIKKQDIFQCFKEYKNKGRHKHAKNKCFKKGRFK